jgi:hypothetical protein
MYNKQKKNHKQKRRKNTGKEIYKRSEYAKSLQNVCCARILLKPVWLNPDAKGRV